MEADFWLARWREGRTHFHQERVEPLLQKYWPSLEVPAGTRVLVPLCGKSLDMVWLAAQGLRVLGVELSPLAVAQFFEGQGVVPEVSESALGTHYRAGDIEILCGDIFALDAETLGSCEAAYDRAALIALPPDMRPDYVRHVYVQLAVGYRGLLMTLDYPQDQMDGPPFSVDDGEVQGLFGGIAQATVIDRRDILTKEPKFTQRGIERLDAVTYKLHELHPM